MLQRLYVSLDIIIAKIYPSKKYNLGMEAKTLVDQLGEKNNNNDNFNPRFNDLWIKRLGL